MIYQVLAAFYCLWLDFDVFVCHSPGMEVWLPFMVGSVLRGKPAVYSVHDVHPDVGIRLGIYKHKWVIGLVRLLEKIFHAADARHGRTRIQN